MVDDEYWMRQALSLAEEAKENNEVPVGAIIVLNNEIIGKGSNSPITSCDPTAHAEIQAIRAACKKIQNYRLPEAVLYVTLEPCSMCAGAIVHARLKRVVYGALEPKSGAIESQSNFFESSFLNHKVTTKSGVLADLSATKMSSFFQNRRRQKKEIRTRQQEEKK
ncbi:tRNA adenosine(34) deaminase TadA [Marinomonas agarivorans]|nr:tRNA adenosine(34) deaminase TadA [Marinomonas agarivorans]